MFGDFDTGLTVTELSRYSRSMTGIKGEFGGDRVGVTAFAADAESGFVKDELRGDGTAGLYRLSAGGIVINSDKLRIEVRDRFRSEIVVESRPLARFLDYSIDYDRGTLFFKQPVPSRDEQFNPVWIVAEYEVLDGGDPFSIEVFAELCSRFAEALDGYADATTGPRFLDAEPEPVSASPGA